MSVFSTVAFTHADTLFAEGNPPEEALTGGFQWAFWVAAAIWGAGLLAAVLFIRREEVTQPGAAEVAAT